MTDILEEMEARIRALPAAERAKLEKKLAPRLARPWHPQPGKQTDAYFSEADELLYGGAAGGGKTDLLIGLATTAHQKSLLFRRQSNDLDGLWQRLSDIVAGRTAMMNSVKKQARLLDNRTIEGGHLEKPGSERSWQGRPHDLIGFDEGAQLDEFKVAFVIQWIRSTTKGQRQRMVIATNPPIPEFDKDGNLIDSGSGDWLLRWFAPWLDDTHPNPAEDGELRWCFMVTEGDRMVTIWVDGPGCYDPETHEFMPDATQDDLDNGRATRAKSRTFIRSLARDNVFLKGTGYVERLSASPEPLRSLLLTGSFNVRGEDHPMQVIPTLWVLRAQQRWNERKHERPTLKQLVLSADIAQGGADTTVLAPLLETDFFDELTTQAGRLTPTGREVVAMLLDKRQDKSLVVLDGSGGWAGSTAVLLEDNHDIQPRLFVAGKASHNFTPEGLYKYANLRAEMWWSFRLALDPKSGYDICLPPSNRLRAQLTTPHWDPRGKELYIESKDEVRKRLSGASTDEADAILQAWQYRMEALAQREVDEIDLIDRIVHGITPAEKRRRKQLPVDLDNPLSDW